MWTALTEAVLADLDSDAPRLVLADALQAAGDPRGELIAIQCELARLGCDRTRLALWEHQPDPRGSSARRDWIGDGLVTGERDRIAALRGRERELLAVQPPLDRACRWGRGFVDHAFDDELSIPQVFERMPMIRSLECSLDVIADLEDPRLAQLRQLRVLADEDLVILEGLERAWPHLRELAVFAPGDARVIEALLASPVLAQLEALDLFREAITPEQLGRVLELSTLRALKLGNRLFGPQLLELVSTHERAATLEILELYMLDGGIGYRWLSQPRSLSRCLSGLRALRIFEQRGSWLGVGMLVGLAELPALRVFDLAGNHAIAANLDELLVGDFPALVRLGLADCALTPDHVARLALAPWIDRLDTLDVRYNKLLAEHLAPLQARAPRLEIRI